MSQLEAFRNDVESYLERAGVLPTQFGKDAINDPNFVSDLRSGRSPSLSTVDRVLSFIRRSEKRRKPEAPEASAA
jgi:predicted transcriptional regulator